MSHQDIVFSCRVHGKLLLCGEHIALCGAGAAGLPVPQHLTLHFQKYDAAFACISQVIAPDGSRSALPIDNVFFSFVREVCKIHALPLLGQTLNGRITLTSTIPIGSGLGSSAALCCAIARLILHYQQNEDAQDENYRGTYQRRVWHLAHRFEQFFHVRASGIDTALCAYGIPLVLHPVHVLHSDGDIHDPPQFRVSSIPREILEQLHLVYGFIPREASCAKTIQTIQQDLRASDNTRAFKKDTAEVLGLLQGANVHELCAALAPCLRRVHAHLVRVRASTPDMEAVIACAYDSGACAAKLSGGGAGGSFVCVCKSDEHARHVSVMLMKKFTSSFAPHAFMACSLLL